MNDSNSRESDSLYINQDAPVESRMPNGCFTAYKNEELADDNDETERVGVLDYMPSYKHLPVDDGRCSKTLNAKLPLNQYLSSNSCDKNPENAVSSCDGDIELKTFSITESCGDPPGESCASFHDARCTVAPQSYPSDDDELLVPAGADTEDVLQEVVVQSERTATPSERGSSPFVGYRGMPRPGRMQASDQEVAPSFRYIPSPFGVARDAAWSNPDTARTSPISSPDLPAAAAAASRNASYAVSSHSNVGESTTVDGFEKQGQSSSRDQSPVFELGKDSVRLGGNQIDPNSVSRQNVVFLNDYAFWPSARALCRDDSSAGGADRSEFEKRQERRDKKRKIHAQPIAYAKDVEGYVGDGKTIEELLEYITKTDGLRRRVSQPNESKKTSVLAEPLTRQAPMLKAKSEMDKTTVAAELSDVASSVTSESVETSDGDLSKSVPKKNSDVKAANSSADYKNRWKKKSHKAPQRGDGSKIGEDFPDEATVSVQSLPSLMSATDSEFSQTATKNSSQLNDLDVSAFKRTNVEVASKSAMVDGTVMARTDESTGVKASVLLAKSSENGSLSSKSKESITSDVATLTEVSSSVEKPKPVVAAPSSGVAANSGYSSLDENVLLVEEDGPWEEFQSKKKRSRNRVHQSAAPFTQRPSLSDVAAVVSFKKNETDVFPVMPRNAGGVSRGGGDANHGHKFSATVENFSKARTQSIANGGVQSVGYRAWNEKSADFSAENSGKPAKNPNLGNNHLVMNEQNWTEASLHSFESSAHVRTTAQDSGSVPCGSKGGPNNGFLLYPSQPNEAASRKNVPAARKSNDPVQENQVKSLNNTDHTTVVFPEVGIPQKHQKGKHVDGKMEKSVKCDATNSKSSPKNSPSASEVGQSSDAATRPAVVFCGKAESQFGDENSGISFEYSDEPPVAGQNTASLPSSDIATSPIAEGHLGTGGFSQVAKSCDGVSLPSGTINCGRPIAPLSGSGHTSLAKTPVLVVSPLPKVLLEEQTASHVVDTDPETLKEVTTIIAPSSRQVVCAEVKEPAAQISVLTGPSVAPNLIGRTELMSTGGNIISLSGDSLELDVGRQDTTQSRKALGQMPTKVALETIRLDEGHVRCARSLHVHGKTLAFDALEAAQYLKIDWEKLLVDGSTIYYKPDKP